MLVAPRTRAPGAVDRHGLQPSRRALARRARARLWMRYTAGISASSSKLKFTLGIRCRPACTAGQGNGMTGLWRRLLIPALVAGAWIHAGAPAYASESLHLGTVPAAVAGGQPFQLTATGTTNNGQAHRRSSDSRRESSPRCTARRRATRAGHPASGSAQAHGEAPRLSSRGRYA